MNTPFHEGELKVQTHAGATQMAARVGTSIREFIPPAAAEWLAEQELMAVASRGDDSAMWASVLTGPPGFIQAQSEYELSVAVGWERQAILHQSLVDDQTTLGTVVLEPANRRRVRFNGRGELTPDGFRLFVDEVYGNCPKYIQARSVSEVDPAGPVLVSTGTELTSAQIEWIHQADTFFLATGHPQRGADCSHRGGLPGFVDMKSDMTLEWEDYPGNAMFNTLGNLEVDPACGLAFIDWATGSVLQLSGNARTRWEGERRFTEFEPKIWRETQGAISQRWQFGEFSPFNPK